MSDQSRRRPRPRRAIVRSRPFDSAGSTDVLTDAERIQVEYEQDRLIELAARAEMWREDSPFYTNEKLIAWLARDLRERAEVCGSIDRAVIDRITERVYVSVQAARLGVADGGPCPPSRTVAVPCGLATLVDAAARDRCAPRSDLAVAAGVGRELWDEPCDAVVPLPSEVPTGRYVALRVDGDSMTPLIHPGDTVLVRLGPDVKPDTLIVARASDGYVVKQVGALSRRGIELRSLNPEYPPMEIPREAARILGTVIVRWCDHDVRRDSRNVARSGPDG